MHFPALFQISPIFEKKSDSVENFLNFTFSRKISLFSFAKISDDLFLVIDHKFRIPPPIFSVSVHFPLVSRKLLFPPHFSKFHPCFTKIHLLLTYFMCISFPPYFDHDAFMHHPMHVLDASESNLDASESNLEGTDLLHQVVYDVTNRTVVLHHIVGLVNLEQRNISAHFRNASVERQHTE